MNKGLKAYKRLSVAQAAANGRPIIKVGDLYIVGEIDRLCELEIISDNGTIVGNVSASHLERLGNANHAIAVSPTGYWYDNRHVFDHQTERAEKEQRDAHRLIQLEDNASWWERRQVRLSIAETSSTG